MAYIGFDNGGVWRSTDYGSTWQPLFDAQSTGSIGAIAVAPSDPSVIYVGSGAGIIRPDLAVGNGMYKSADTGKTWTHLGLDDTQMIAHVDVDPANPNRLFVAALGHPYGPNAERGVYRSTDGGRSFQKVLFKDEYTSANDVRIDPSDPNTVYAALWQQQQSYIEGGSFGGTNGGIFKSTDGGTTWRQLTEGLPTILQANLAIAPSNPKTIYATVAGQAPGGPAGPVGFGGGQIGFYKSTDGGEHWTLVNGAGVQGGGRVPDNRPLARIGGGDLPTIAVDTKNENVVYSASVVFWRTEDGGLTWTAVRGAPGGDDYQKLWINPNNPNVLIVVSDQGAVITANRGASWSNWYTQPTAAMYHVSADNTFVYRVCGGQQDSGSACVDSRSMDGEITFHDWHPVNIQEYGIAAPDPRDPDMVYGSQRSGVSLYNRKTGQTTQVGPDATVRGPNGEAYNRNVRTMPVAWSPVEPGVLFYASNVVWKSTDHAHSWTRISPDLARQAWAVPANAGTYAAGVTPAPAGSITALSLSPRSVNVIWAGTDDGNIQTTSDGGTTWKNVTPTSVKPWARVFNIDAGHFDNATAYAAVNTMRLDDMNPHLFRTHDGGRTWTEINTGIAPGNVTNSIREDPRVRGLLYASTDAQVWVSFDDGDHWQSLQLNLPNTSCRDLVIKGNDLVVGTYGRGIWVLDDFSPLRQIASAGEPVHLFAPGDAVRVRRNVGWDTPFPPEVPHALNPPDGALIYYYLAARPAADITLDVLDSAGAVVRHLSSVRPAPVAEAARPPEPNFWLATPEPLPTAVGTNRVNWDVRYDAPAALTHTFEISANPGLTPPSPVGPLALPGTYTLRLTVDGKRYSQTVKVRNDPRSPATLADLRAQHALQMAIYRALQESSDRYHEVTAMRAAVAADTGAPAEVATAAKALDSALAAVAGNPDSVGGFGRRSTRGPPSFASVDASLVRQLNGLETGDLAPTGSMQLDYDGACADLKTAVAAWAKIDGTGLAAFNAVLTQHHLQAIAAAASPPIPVCTTGRGRP